MEFDSKSPEKHRERVTRSEKQTAGFTHDASTVIDAELNHILGRTRQDDVEGQRHRLIGLALSGGGVRSASFSLGVLQALAGANRLKDVHYMSTVSGGGYIGSSLSWFTSRATRADRANENKSRIYCDTTSKYFPFGAKELARFSTHTGSRASLVRLRDEKQRKRENKRKERASDKQRASLVNAQIDQSLASLDAEIDDIEAKIGKIDESRIRVDILSYIRQNANYLSPSGVDDIFAIISMFLRAMLPSFFVYFCLLIMPITLIAYVLASAPFSDPTVLSHDLSTMANPSGDEAVSPEVPASTPTHADNESNQAEASASVGRSDADNGGEGWTIWQWISNNAAWRIAAVQASVLALATLLTTAMTSLPRTGDKVASTGQSAISKNQKVPEWLFLFSLMVILTCIFAIILLYIEQPVSKFIAAAVAFSICIGFSTSSPLSGAVILSGTLLLPVAAWPPKAGYVFYWAAAMALILTAIVLKRSWSRRPKPPSVVFFWVRIALAAAVPLIFLQVPALLGEAVAIFLAAIAVCLFAWFHLEDKRLSDLLGETYRIRRITARHSAFLIAAVLGPLALGFLPIVHDWTEKQILGVSLTAAGIASYFGKMFLDLREINLKFLRMDVLLVVISSVFLILGLLSLAFTLSVNFGRMDLPDSVQPSYASFAEWFGECAGFSNPGGFMQLLALTIVLAVGGLVVGWFGNINLVGLHRLYRDRLMEAFLPDVYPPEDDRDQPKVGNAEKNANAANKFCVHELQSVSNGPARQCPYHIINTNIVLVNSDDSRYRGRGGANFIIAPLYCGSDATGWRRSDRWQNRAGLITLPTAMAVSGAAVNPRTGPSGRGPMRTPLVSFLMTFFNARLGLWVLNPRDDHLEGGHGVGSSPDIGSQVRTSSGLGYRYRMTSLAQTLATKPHAQWVRRLARGRGEREVSIPIGRPSLLPSPNFLSPGLRQGLLGKGYNEKEKFIELTDGAHFDNTGLYELIRRNVRLIILVDGSEDKEFTYAGLASAFERIRVDFGVQIRFGESSRELENMLHDPDEKGIFSRKFQLAKRGYAIARIDYQPHQDKGGGDEDGLLVIIKSTMVQGLPADVLGYKSANPDFPDESTADQFFDEIQLEAYRELGYRIAKNALEDELVEDEFEYCRSGQRPAVNWKSRPPKA